MSELHADVRWAWLLGVLGTLAFIRLLTVLL